MIRKYNRLQFILTLLMTLCMVCAMGGCQSAKKEDISLYDLQKAMIEADTTLPDMATANSSSDDAADNFAYLSDLDYEKVDGYFLAYSSEGKADEIAVIRVKNEKDVEEAKKSLEKHAQGRVSLYKTYDPDQVTRAEGAVIFTKGRYAVLIISDDSEASKKVFMDTVS